MNKEIEMLGIIQHKTRTKNIPISYYDSMTQSSSKDVYSFERTTLLQKCSFFQFCWWNLKLFKWIFVCVNFQGLFCSKLNQTKFAPKLLPYLLQNNSVTTTWHNTVLIIPKFSVTGRLNLLEEFSKQVTNFTPPAIKI